MAIFVILPQGDETEGRLPEVLAREFPDGTHLQLPSNSWLVSGQGTAVEISNKVGITKAGPGGKNVPGPTGTAMVFEIASYYGNAATNIWDWVRVNLEKTDG